MGVIFQQSHLVTLNGGAREVRRKRIEAKRIFEQALAHLHRTREAKKSIQGNEKRFLGWTFTYNRVPKYPYPDAALTSLA